MAIADGPAKSGRIVRHRVAKAIDVDIVVAGAVHLGETHVSRYLEDCSANRWIIRKRSGDANSGEELLPTQKAHNFLPPRVSLLLDGADAVVQPEVERFRRLIGTRSRILPLSTRGWR